MISGRIHRIFDMVTIGDNFQKREFVLETGDNPQYPQYRKIEFTRDKCALLDNFQEGQVVDVEVNLNGRAWTGNDGVEKFFNTDVAWKISLSQ